MYIDNLAVEDSRRVYPERPRWPVVPPPASSRREPPPPPTPKGRGPASAPQLAPSPSPSPRAGGDAARVRAAFAASSNRPGRKLEVEIEDVIDLGAPRTLRQVLAEPRAPRVRRALQPNPRLYPGPVSPRVKPKPPPKVIENPKLANPQPHRRHSENRRADNRGSGEKRGRRRKHVFRRVVPNPRLYRPPAARPPPPPATPRAKWTPLVSGARLDTASRAALHFSEQQHALRLGLVPGSITPPQTPQSPQLVVTLPPSGAGPPPQRYRPTSAHFRLRSLDTASDDTSPVAGRSRTRTHAFDMDPGNRQSTSPEDCSEGNETLSAPSEFLAEFLSAIMRRQYAEALKYCRLILQYEPHNTTARGFYPLLQHKVQAHKRPDEEWPRGSSSEEVSAPASEPPAARYSVPRAAHHKHEKMEQGGDSSEGSDAEEGDASRPSSRSGGSCCSQSSLEMDSSEALVHSSPSISLSRRTEHTDSVSGGGCESVGSASRSEADDNGNAPSAPAARLCAGDVENDNAAVAGEPLSAANLKSDSLASLRRLRAQFTCSIK